MKRTASNRALGDTKRVKVDVLASRFKAFIDASFEDGILSSKEFLPYSQQEIKKMFIRQCYVDVFELFLTKIQDGDKYF